MCLKLRFCRYILSLFWYLFKQRFTHIWGVFHLYLADLKAEMCKNRSLQDETHLDGLPQAELLRFPRLKPIAMRNLMLTHSHLEPLKVKGKQCTPRSDATLCGVWSRFTLFANMSFPSKIECKRQNRPNTPKMTNGCVQHITVEESTSIQRDKSQRRDT